jgi:hypothetical protein
MWFNPAAFANPVFGTFGNTHRNTLLGPGFANINLSIAKEFPLHEAIALEIRADMFDVFNHINWSTPDLNVGYSGGVLADSTAGQVTTPVNFGTDARIVQLGAHVRF